MAKNAYIHPRESLLLIWCFMSLLQKHQPELCCCRLISEMQSVAKRRAPVHQAEIACNAITPRIEVMRMQLLLFVLIGGHRQVHH